MKTLTETQREARRRRSRRQQARLKAEVEKARRELAERPLLPEVVVPLVRPARSDERFETATFCGRPIKVLRVGPREPQP